MASQVEKRLGRQVAAYRQTAGLTQEELAEKVGVAVETISRLERGSSIPSLERLEEIGDALGVQLRDLLDFREGRTDRDDAVEALVREMKRREPADVVLVYDLAKRVFAEFKTRRVGRRAR